MLRAAVVVLLCCTAALALRHLEHSRPLDAPQGWMLAGPAMDDEKVELVLALKQSNLDKLTSKFWRVSDPSHADYGHYWSLEEVAQVIAPEAAHMEAAQKWLQNYGIVAFRTVLTGDFLVADVPVSVAQEMLHCRYHRWYHAASNTHVLRSLGPYSVPEDVAEALDFIGGVLRFPDVKARLTSNQQQVDRQLQVTPSVIRQQFSIGNYIGKSSSNKQAVAQFLGQYYDESDLAMFLGNNNLPNQTIAKLVGPNDPTQPGMEAMLDVEYIIGVGTAIPTWFVSTGGEHQGQERFLVWILAMMNDTNAPWVHSVSYGDTESSLSREYTDRINEEFKKFGVTGRSILFSSGDDGAGCNQATTRFEPNFPASSPYVTAVGGTVLTSSSSQSADTIASGGFSNYFSMPSYQRDFALKYLADKTGMPPDSFYNHTGRAIPDIASFSENVIIVYGGNQTPVGGTSCASPVVSAVISLLNDVRLQKGMSTLGFLNPMLYSTLQSHPDAFYDVTTGSNMGCPSQNGFPARAGWDPITGVGTPNFQKLMQYL